MPLNAWTPSATLPRTAPDAVWMTTDRAAGTVSIDPA
jgi:hypothetical protein